MPFVAACIDLEIIILSEVSQKEKEISYVITYMWNLKHGTNSVSMKQKQSHRHREQTCGCHRRGCVGKG